MNEHPFTIDLSTWLRQAAADPAEAEHLAARLRAFQLSPLEQLLLVSLFPPGDYTPANLLDQYERFIVASRGAWDETRAWSSEEEVQALRLTKAQLETDNFSRRVFHSVHLWHTGDYHRPAIRLLAQFESFTAGNFLFLELDDVWRQFYIRATLALFVHYSRDLPSDYQALLMNSPLFFRAVVGGFDLNQAIKEAVGYFLLYEFRQDFAVQLSAFLYSNPTAMGKKSATNETATLADWIEQFGQYSKNSFSEASLEKFITEEPVWIHCTPEERTMITFAILIYARLIGGAYSLATTTVQDMDWQKLLTVRAWKPIDTMEIKGWLAAAYDPAAMKNFIINFLKKFDWQKQPALDNLMILSQVFEERFGADTEPLIYFDERTRKFVWNNK